MDLKWPKMPSKVNFGHPIWQIDQKWPEMQSKSYFNPRCPPAAILSKISQKKKIFHVDLECQKCDRKWISNIQNGRRQPFCQKFPKKRKLRIDLKWPEMQSKVNFEHPKRQPFCQNFQKKIKLRIDLKWPERRSIESEFRTSKMTDGSHFVKNLKKKIKIPLLI